MFNNPNLEEIFAGAPDYTEGEQQVEEQVTDEPGEDQIDDTPGDDIIDNEVEEVEDEPEYEEEVEEEEQFDINDFMGAFGQLTNPQQQPQPQYQQPQPQYQQPQMVNPYMQQNPYGLQLQQPQQPQYMLDHMQQMQEQQEAQMRQMQLQSEVATLAQTDSDFQLVAEDFMGVVSESTDLLQMEGGVAMAYEVAKARYVMNNLDNIIQGAVNEYKQAESRKRVAQAPKVTKTPAQQVSAEQSQMDAILASRPKRIFG